MGFTKYVRLYFHLVKYNITAQMEFRANFIISILTEVAFLCAKALYIIVLFSAGLGINGLSPEQMLMFIGSYTIITGVMDSVFYPNIAAIPEYIRTASLDIYLTKPVNSLFMASLRKFDLGLGIPNVAAGLAMVIISWIMTGTPVTLLSVAGFLFFTVIGCLMTFPILMIPVTLSFWIIKSDAIMEVIWALWDFNNMPMTIYSRGIRLVGTFIVPIFLITNFAPLFVFGMLPVTAGIFSVVAIPIFFGLAIGFWNVAVKNYSSGGG